MAEAGNAVFRATAKFGDLRRGARGAAGDLRGMRDAGGEANTRLRRVQDGMDRAGKKMRQTGTTLTKSVTLPLVAMGGAAVKAFADFEDQMTESLAIMGDVSADTREEMKQTAREVGRTTTHSATEAAEAYFFLASAGMDAEQQIAAMPQVAKFAQAGMFDMATATDIATDAQSALGLTSEDATENLEELTRVTDVLTGMNQRANASVQQFGEALTAKAAARMRALGIELEEGVAVLGAFADQGIKGQLAGNLFDAMLRDMTKAASENKEQFEELNVEVFDADGNLRNMADIVSDLEDAMGDMSAEQQTAALTQLGFTSRAQDGINALMGMSDTLEEYEGGLRDAGEATEEVADKQMESFSKQVGLLKDRVVDVGISLGEDLMPHLKTLVGWLERAVDWFEGLDEGQRKTILAVAGVVAAVGPLLVVLGTLASSVSKIIALGGTMRGGLRRLRGGLRTTGEAAGGTRGKMGRLGSFMRGGFPIAVGAAVGALAILEAKAANVAEETASLRTELDKTPASLQTLTDEFIVNRLQQNDVVAVAERLGLELETIRQAALGNAAAMEEVRQKTGGTQNVVRNLQGLIPGLRSEELDLYRMTLDLAEATGNFNSQLEAEKKLLGQTARWAQELNKWIRQLPDNKRVAVEVVTHGFGGPSFNDSPTGHSGGRIGDLPLTSGPPRGDERMVKARENERLLTEQQNRALERGINPLSGGMLMQRGEVASLRGVAAMSPATAAPRPAVADRGRGGTTIEKVEINNPKPESTEESVPRTVRKLAYLGY